MKKLTKAGVVEDIYKLSIPEKVWKRAKDSLFLDYKQEMYLLLLEMPNCKFFDLYEQGKLADYFWRICQLQTCEYSVFFKKIFGKIQTESLSEEFNYDFDDKDDRE